MAAKKNVKSSRGRRASTQKINVVSKASIRMLNPAYAMGIHSLSDDDSGRDVDSDDAYGGCETSDSWKEGLSTVASKQRLSQVPEETPAMTALSGREPLSSAPRQANVALGNALGLRAASLESRAASMDTVRDKENHTSVSPATKSVFDVSDSPPSTSSPMAAPQNEVSPNTLSFSRFFPWKRGQNKLSKTPQTKKPQLSTPPQEIRELPISAPAQITTFAEAQARDAAAASGNGASVAPSSPEEKRQARFKAHLNDLYKSYALDNRYIGENMAFLHSHSPPQASNMSPYFAIPLSPNHVMTPLPHFAKATQRRKPGKQQAAPTLRQVRKATPSTIGMQHQAMMAQRYYDSTSSLASYTSLASSPSSTPPRRMPVRGSSASSAMPSSGSNSSLSQNGSPLRRVTSVGRGTRKTSQSMRSAPSFQLLPDFSFNGQTSRDGLNCLAASSSSSSSLSDAREYEDAGVPLRRGVAPRRKRANSQPRRQAVPNVPPMPSRDAFGISSTKEGSTASHAPAEPLPPLPNPSASLGSGQARAGRRRSKSFDSAGPHSRLRPAEMLTPTSPLSPTLESLVDGSDTFWPDFMTEELNLKRQQTMRNLAQVAARPTHDAKVPSDDHEAPSEESVAKLAQRVTLQSHSQVVGVSSPRMICLSPRLSDRGSMMYSSGSFRRPTSAMSTATVRPASKSDTSSPLLRAASSSDDKRISTASTIRPSSTSMGSEHANLLGAPVVNVMPPTPDMSVDENGFYSGADGIVSNETAVIHQEHTADTPEVRVPFEQQAEEEVPPSPVLEAKAVPLPDAHTVLIEKEDVARECDIGSVNEEDTTISTQPIGDDEEFSFVRSLSSMSIASSSDGSSNSSNDDLDAEVNSAIVGNAQVVNVRSPAITPSRFSKAHVVSPSITSLATLPSGTSLALAMLGSPPRATNASPPRVDQTPGLSYASSSSASSFMSSAQRSEGLRHAAETMSPSTNPSMESRESMASMMTTSTSILDFGSDMIHRDSVLERLNASAFGHERLRKYQGKSPEEEAITAFGDLRSPASIQNILNYVHLAAPGGRLNEDDCDTPRLQSSGFHDLFASKNLPQTRPLNVRKNASKTSLHESASGGSSYHDAITPSSAPMGVTRSSPGARSATRSLASPSSRSLYPRDENTPSPNLELDLSKPLDLHGIGLGVKGADCDADKPRRRGAGKTSAGGQRLRSQSNVDQRRPSTEHCTAKGKLMASAMETPECAGAMGLGLDLSGDCIKTKTGHIIGIQDSPENGYEAGSEPFSPSPAVRHSSKALRKVASARPDDASARRPNQKYQYYSAESYCENGIGFAM